MDNKRQHRIMKREIKKLGNKKRRQWLKRQLEDYPEDAPYDDYDFGELTSRYYNGKDKDKTRKREEYEEYRNYNINEEERESF